MIHLTYGQAALWAGVIAYASLAVTLLFADLLADLLTAPTKDVDATSTTESDR